MKKRRILIVEDNADLRRLYAIGLNQRGFEVKLAANGAEAVDRIASERPDAIILDLVMPVMDGWEVIERVNPSGGPRRTDIPVIVVSGYPRPADRPIPPSVFAWLAKPASLDEVAGKLNEIDAAQAS
jgi:two-component system OmpR family response regulator